MCSLQAYNDPYYFGAVKFYREVASSALEDARHIIAINNSSAFKIIIRTKCLYVYIIWIGIFITEICVVIGAVSLNTIEEWADLLCVR